ncbi:hypothetical protein DEU56DRAFT_902856 [Suillus clintonianus]|uniref:uncharacterized protein n=1 Tax=Suillus clintonianus TaxID=1904413 RepID=UPI001B87E5AC|nr:uncharacterized protein DEU56DRAFT_902856 [Suillus clintonianus]KAG2129588.1 hypothetical protein DEU56DRAFT_902856 [Suillus clintonianus]
MYIHRAKACATIPRSPLLERQYYKPVPKNTTNCRTRSIRRPAPSTCLGQFTHCEDFLQKTGHFWAWASLAETDTVKAARTASTKEKRMISLRFAFMGFSGGFKKSLSTLIPFEQKIFAMPADCQVISIQFGVVLPGPLKAWDTEGLTAKGFPKSGQKTSGEREVTRMYGGGRIGGMIHRRYKHTAGFEPDFVRTLARTLSQTGQILAFYLGVNCVRDREDIGHQVR